MDDKRLEKILEDFALATAVRPPCEARIDPDTCVACTAWTTDSLEAGVRLWGQARAPGTIKALAAEVMRLRERVAKAESAAAGYLADHAAAMLDLAAATARAEKAEAERDALRAAALEYTDAYVAACEAIARVAGRKDLEAAWGAAGVARERLRTLAGEG